VLRSIIPVGVAPLIDTHHLVGAARNTIPLRRADRWIDPPSRAAPRRYIDTLPAPRR